MSHCPYCQRAEGRHWPSCPKLPALPTPPLWAAVGLLFRPGGQVLAINRPGRPDDICLPGGKMEPGETPEQALVRELLEETGITVDPAGLEALYDRVDPTVNRSARCFLVRRWSGVPMTREHGLVVRWVEAEELVRPENTFFDWARIALARAGHSFPKGASR